jgi:hypothetical protein
MRLSSLTLLTGLLCVLLTACDLSTPAEDQPLPTLAVLPSITPSVAPSRTPRPTLTPTITPTVPYYARLGTLIGTLETDQIRRGRFTIPEERQIYTFAGVAESYITVQMEAVSGELDPVVALFGPDGTRLAVDDGSGSNGEARLRNIRLSSSGTFTVQAWGKGLGGDYALTLATSLRPLPVTPIIVTPVPTLTLVPEVLTPTVPVAANGEPLLDHQVVQGNIDRPGSFIRYAISASPGDRLNIGLSLLPDSLLRPRLELYDPEGQLIRIATIADSNAAGDVLIADVQAGLTGTYVVFVTGDGNSTGAYQLSYGLGNSRADVRRGAVEPDRVITSSLFRRGWRDVWSIVVRAGDVISVAVDGTGGGLDPLVEIVAPDGSLLAVDDNSGGGTAAFISSANIPFSGRYLLRVASVGSRAAGSYTLVWRYLQVAPTFTPPPVRIPLLVYADEVPNNVYQSYPFYGVAGMTVEIRVTAAEGSSLDPVVALLDAQGMVLAEADDGPTDLNPVLVTTLPADGTYIVRVNGYLSGGRFRLTVDGLY